MDAKKIGIGIAAAVLSLGMLAGTASAWERAPYRYGGYERHEARRFARDWRRHERFERRYGDWYGYRYDWR
jgi:hypothetical protein